ncbi:MAG TPA: hypothetical protein DEB31_02635 [Clostridiales bacterium]|nr:hypothetical protein [Clostridiales bacterium]
MRSRADIKRQAFYQFKTNYWPTVGAAVLFLLLSLTMNIPAVGFLIGLLLIPVVTVGYSGYFIERFQGRPASLSLLTEPFSRYGRALGGMLWMYLWIFLWSLIFAVALISLVVPINLAVAGFYGSTANIWGWVPLHVTSLWIVLVIAFAGLIPVIIKSLSYSCTPYILADCPNVPATQALSLSKRVMNGNKAKLFVAGLSFIPWMLIPVGIAIAFTLLNANVFYFGYLSVGIVILEYVLIYAYLTLFLAPYMSATFAGFYLEIREDAVRRGVVAPWEFNPPAPQYNPPQQYNQQQQYYTPPQYGQPPQGQQSYAPPQYGAPPQGQQNYAPPQYGQPPQGQQNYMSPQHGVPPQDGQPPQPPQDDGQGEKGPDGEQ